MEKTIAIVHHITVTDRNLQLIAVANIMTFGMGKNDSLLSVDQQKTDMYLCQKLHCDMQPVAFSLLAMLTSSSIHRKVKQVSFNI
ncbi:hypothetical protein T07_10466 [Trichinella nelsoni]|uniref:Uncharacterized protein n=1 Tax=Trichinella nelsoni TaxID=6336 RepID=A0A0V0RQ90_9BILA|nr:hypothetical protein T07_10466 [Trichinella nelsoni]